MIAINCYRIISLIDGPPIIITQTAFDNEKSKLKSIGDNFRTFKIEGKEKGITKIIFTVVSAAYNNKIAVI